MKKVEIILIGVNFIVGSLVLIYSYTQVDLNLTLTSNKLALGVINGLQQIGYYNRPISSFLYIAIIAFMFSSFILNLYLFSRKALSKSYLLISTLTATSALILSYPFLSSDLFNYMFDAKIITHYQLNPYTYKPLDFPNDEWLRFMRWVHRYSPYGPLWLAASVVPSLLGFGKFLITLFAFKFLIGLLHMINSLIIYKTLKGLKKEWALFGTAFYALNPLFLIEGVANAHNDIFHATLVLLSIFLLYKNKSISMSLLAVLAGALIKYLAFLSFIPVLVARVTRYNKFEQVVVMNLVLYVIFTILYSSFQIRVPFISSGSLQTQFQPWYLFWTIPLVSLLAHNKTLVVIAILFCFFAQFRYLPFLYYGEWSKPFTFEFMQTMIIVPAALALIFTLYSMFSRRFHD